MLCTTTLDFQTTDGRSPTPPGTFSKDPIILNSDDDYLQLQTWTVCRIKFDGPSYKHTVNRLLAAMADYTHLSLISSADMCLQTHVHWNLLYVFSNPCTLDPPINHEQRSKRFGFDVIYMMECCITQNYLLERNLCKAFYHKLENTDPSLACGMLEVIALDKKRVWDPLSTLNAIWKKYKMKLVIQRSIPNHCSMLRKPVVTPTAVYMQAPTMETVVFGVPDILYAYSVSDFNHYYSSHKSNYNTINHHQLICTLD